MAAERRTTWWGYTYLDGTIQLRQFHPTEEEKREAKKNPLILNIVEPFLAENRVLAEEELKKRLNGRARNQNPMREDIHDIVSNEQRNKLDRR